MWRAIGWLLVFLFPIVMVYLNGGPDKEPLLDDHEYERRKRNAKLAAEKKKKQEEAAIEQQSTKKNKKNKKKAKTVPVVVEEKKKEELVIVEKVEPTSTKKKNKKNKNQTIVVEQLVKPVAVEEKKVEPSAIEKKAEPIVEKNEVQPTKEESVNEIDEHMDPTANYARVMRIRPEESEDEWEAVPYEEGWSQVKCRRPHAPSMATIDVNAEINNNVTVMNSKPDKKQRENLNRAQKKKDAKAAADKLQEERLRKHQKELEKIKIQEFYSSGKGKNTPWGKNGQRSSSKVPQSVASVNEFGQLIWD